MTDSDLADWLGASLGGLGAVPVWVLAPMVVLLVIVLREFTSSMATIITFVPIVAGVVASVGHDPVIFAMMVTQACQCAFMLPVASAPNAIAFSTGELKISHMVKAGLWMTVVGLILVSSLALFVLPVILR